MVIDYCFITIELFCKLSTNASSIFKAGVKTQSQYKSVAFSEGFPTLDASRLNATKILNIWMGNVWIQHRPAQIWDKNTEKFTNVLMEHLEESVGTSPCSPTKKTTQASPCGQTEIGLHGIFQSLTVSQTPRLGTCQLSVKSDFKSKHWDSNGLEPKKP